MEFALIIVVLLIVLAIICLFVGVSNDAANFVTAALGSHAASFKTVLTFAVIGVIVGVTFSSGMMDIAKSGIFYPQYFNLIDLMYIFISVMFASILLLNLFASYGLPTSTTVTLVSGLFGSAFSISFLKLLDTPDQLHLIFNYLNVANLLKIFLGIILSIGIAFICGFIVQFLVRLTFTFDYKKRLKRYGGLWVGLSITILTYFIFLKGISGISFISQETLDYITHHQTEIFAGTFIVCTILGQIVLSLIKLNVLKFIVLLGTFSLALSFAANDLVNFIGTPLAGLASYQLALTFDSPLTTNMGALATTKVQAETWMLLIAGVIMASTLIFSKRPRNIVKTGVSLARQEDSSGFERFESNAIARGMVRMTIQLFETFTKFVPRRLKVTINKRFNIAKYKPTANTEGELPAFDLLRASVILTVSSALISFGTSLKLPLSTTYVTFIVSMAAAFADRSWGRESAVYRVSGVITVVGGWFFTAFVSITIAFIIAAILFYTKYIGIAGFVAVSIWSFYKTNKLNKEKEQDEEAQQGKLKAASNELELANNIQQNISEFINESTNILNQASFALIDGNLKELKTQRKAAKKVGLKINPIVSELINSLSYTSEDHLEKRELLPRTITSFVSISDNLLETTKSMQSYIDNNHYLFLKEQAEELDLCCEYLEVLNSKIITLVNTSDLYLLQDVEESFDNIKSVIKKNNKMQLKRIKKNTSAMKRSMLFITIMRAYDNYVEDLKTILEAIKEAIETATAYKNVTL